MRDLMRDSLKLTREFTESNIGTKQGRVTIFCQSRNMERFFFDATSFRESTVIEVTEDLYSSSTLFVGPNIDIQWLFNGFPLKQ